jgi:hypothetical protein
MLYNISLSSIRIGLQGEPDPILSTQPCVSCTKTYLIINIHSIHRSWRVSHFRNVLNTNHISMLQISKSKFRMNLFLLNVDWSGNLLGLRSERTHARFWTPWALVQWPSGFGWASKSLYVWGCLLIKFDCVNKKKVGWSESKLLLTRS